MFFQSEYFGIIRDCCLIAAASQIAYGKFDGDLTWIEKQSNG